MINPPLRYQRWYQTERMAAEVTESNPLEQAEQSPKEQRMASS
jgi:hypothetical protein